MWRSDYTDDPPESPAQETAVKWAEAWRAITHFYEEWLLEQPEVRSGMADGAVSGDEPVVYVLGGSATSRRGRQGR